MSERELPPTDLLLVGKEAYLSLQDEVRSRGNMGNLYRQHHPIDAPWTAVIRALLVDYNITPKTATTCESAANE